MFSNCLKQMQSISHNFYAKAPIWAPGHSSVNELFSPGREADGARPSLAQVRNSTSESHLLKTVASGGLWHSEEKSEEALMTNPNFGPNRRQNELGLRSWH